MAERGVPAAFSQVGRERSREHRRAARLVGASSLGSRGLDPEAIARAIRHRGWRSVHAWRSRPDVSDRRQPRRGEEKREPERAHRSSVPAARRSTKAFSVFLSTMLTDGRETATLARTLREWCHLRKAACRASRSPASTTRRHIPTASFAPSSTASGSPCTSARLRRSGRCRSSGGSSRHPLASRRSSTTGGTRRVSPVRRFRS